MSITIFCAIKRASLDLPHAEARLLLGFVLQQKIEYLLTRSNEEISHDQEEHFFLLVARRKMHEPIAYILGKKEFYGRDFIVTQDTLIPRADTEVLIDATIELVNKKSLESLNALDLGTGSGILAITLALELKHLSITAVDKMDAALDVANQNIAHYGLKKQIELIKSDWYSNLRTRKFDIIISNPPYISTKEQNVMASETILYEPKEALYADNNGLAAYEAIISQATQFLNARGCLVLEIGFEQYDQVADILHYHHFGIEHICKDLQGYKRGIIATKKEEWTMNLQVI